MTFSSLIAYRHALRPETYRNVTRSTASRAFSWLSALVLTSTLTILAPHARANTLPQLSEACFTYTPGHQKPGSNGFTSNDFRAELPGTGLSLRIASTHLTDHAHHLDASGLERINAAAAYAALTALHHGLSDACRTMPIPETDEIKNATPEAHWSMATLSQRGKTDITVKTIHLSVLSTSPGIHTIFSATGLPTDHPLLPRQLSGDITFYAAPRPPYHVELHSVKSTIGRSDIEGHGTMQVAPSLQDLQSTLHLSISHIGSLIDQVGKVAPAKITTALLVARLMSIHEGEHLSGWNIHVEHGQATVNGVSLPLPKK